MPPTIRPELPPGPILDRFAHVPAIADCFGLWAIQAPVLRAAAQRLENLDLVAHVQEARAESPLGAGYTVAADGVALIEVRGVLAKRGNSLAATRSTVALRQQLRAADQDDQVRAIALLLETPGGTLAGTREAATAIRNTAKPTWAFVEDLTASAGYWLASQADRIVANATALVGSIGTYALLIDSSESARQIGVTVHVVKAGEFKGAGVEGTPVTAEILAHVQALIDGQNEFFLNGVADGRANLSLEQVRTLADGREYLAAEAQQLGLIDGISSLDDFLSELGALAMAQSDPTPASLADLKAAFPDAASEFLIECLELDSTIAEAHELYTASLQKQLKAEQAAAQAAREAQAQAEQSAATARAELATAQQAVPAPDSVDGIAATSEDTESGETFEDPKAEWKRRIAAAIADGMPRIQAVGHVAQECPELHAAYVDSYNAAHPHRR